jgi:hydrogenase expression/formation protein HypC
MCLSIPAKIISIDGEMAKVSIGGTIIDASVSLIDKPAVGEFVLLHTGFAIERISEEEAAENMKYLNELAEFGKTLEEGGDEVR